jgi:glycosyltransferase involved in cell wall biosynthesis
MINLEHIRKIGFRGEILLILDEADDETKNQALHFLDSVRVLECNFGDPSLARNYGVSKSENEYIAFLDGDDIWGSDWIVKALKTNNERIGEQVLVHPEFNYYFSDLTGSGRNLMIRQISSLSSDFDVDVLASQNFWTVMSLGHRNIYESHPFVSNNLTKGLGYEDWTFNIETLSSGIPHLVSEGTIHFIREKSTNSVSASHSKDFSTFIPSDLWF